jgi:hypothetical protein
MRVLLSRGTTLAVPFQKLFFAARLLYAFGKRRSKRSMQPCCVGCIEVLASN